MRRPGRLIERLQARQARRGRQDRAAMVYWLMGLMGLGAAVLLGFAVSVGAWRLGLALAARLAFVLILLGAALPWLRRGRERG
jgi:hypothetical protein